MDVLVCGTQVPFMYGGAEQLTENLVDAFRAAGHRCEAVRLPTAWDRERLLDAALAWRLLPLQADLVVATNFPSYFVRHPRKVVYLFHQHRGAYDLAGSQWSDLALDEDGLETQRQLAEWDTRALSEAERIFTISGVVSERLGRFNGLASEPLYHPEPLADRLHPGPFGDEVFCALRLEQNKRPELLVELMGHVRSNIRMAVAGRGTRAEALGSLARERGVDGRVDLLGFVADDELVRRYASCLCVVYAPYDEDLGYVTLQAFRAGKPVVTASDAGGVLEWVQDGVNGFVTDGSPEAMADAVDRLAGDRALAARMGEAGRATVERMAGSGWRPVVDRLLGGDAG